MENIKSKKIALITGATSGIGEATAKKLANKFSLILCGRRQEKLTTLSKSLSNLTTIKTLTFDVRDKDDVSTKLNELEGEWKNIDILINNAGIFTPAAPIDEIEVNDWLESVNVNLTGSFLCARAAFKKMRAQSPMGGRIIKNGSISAHVIGPH